MKKYSLLSTLFAIALSANTTTAATLRFLSGEVYAAELSTNTMLIGNADKPANNYENDENYSAFNTSKKLAKIGSSKKGYLVLFVKLDQGRKISIYDYVVKTREGQYNCVSLAKGNDMFEPFDPADELNKNWVFDKAGTMLKMLFVIEHEKASESNTLASFTLKHQLYSDKLPQKMKALCLGSSEFSKSSAVKFGKYIESLQPPVVATPEPAPAAEADPEAILALPESETKTAE